LFVGAHAHHLQRETPISPAMRPPLARFSILEQAKSASNNSTINYRAVKALFAHPPLAGQPLAGPRRRNRR